MLTVLYANFFLKNIVLSVSESMKDNSRDITLLKMESGTLYCYISNLTCLAGVGKTTADDVDSNSMSDVDEASETNEVNEANEV